MKSEYKFESYKIDLLTLKIAQTVNLLEFSGSIPADQWKIEISVRTPQYVKSQKKYISGLEVEVNVFGDQEDDSEPQPSLIHIKAGISGLFKAKEERFLSDEEKKIVMIQFPALLLPYLRSAITGLVANAGLGTFIFPLVNLRDSMRDVIDKTEIQVIE